MSMYYSHYMLYLGRCFGSLFLHCPLERWYIRSGERNGDVSGEEGHSNLVIQESERAAIA